MKKSLTIILFFLTITSCDKDKRDLRTYNQFLGLEKSNAFEKGVEVFDQFLIDNFSEQPTHGLRVEAFLEKLIENPNKIGPDTNWLFNSKWNKEVFQLLESTGMRKEIRLYGYEEYDSGLDSSDYITLEIEDEDELIPVAGQDSLEFEEQKQRLQKLMENQQNRLDSTLWFNVRGKYLQGLKLVQNRDDRILNYIEAVETIGNTNFQIAVEGALEGYEPKDFEDPFIKRIIFAEIYWYIMEWDLERNK